MSLSPRLREYLEIQYDIVRVLGSGGMGVVLLAHERALGRDVAIKVLRGDTDDQAELRERFRREARTAAKLTHPNIVPLYTFGEVGGDLYFVMAFVEGETLAARLTYVRENHDLMSVKVTAGAGATPLTLSDPTPLFHIPDELLRVEYAFYTPWDVAADGRFIMARTVRASAENTPVTVVAENWFQELKAKMKR